MNVFYEWIVSATSNSIHIVGAISSFIPSSGSSRYRQFGGHPEMKVSYRLITSVTRNNLYIFDISKLSISWWFWLSPFLMDILLRMCIIGGSYQQQAICSNEQQETMFLVSTTLLDSLVVLVIGQLLSKAFSSACPLWVYHISSKQRVLRVFLVLSRLSIAQGIRRQVSLPSFGDLLHDMDGMKIQVLFVARVLLSSTTRIKKAFPWLYHWHVKDVIVLCCLGETMLPFGYMYSWCYGLDQFNASSVHCCSMRIHGLGGVKVDW
ncbi:hypothetical protein O0I10_002647 [Lichtheimia ornata]|uniref:Uncharacterized protein n=1 Tax=Lichtheimia ornata TaxID=688661 RepID=A0AAD7VAE1_9FUNG|nr:uncharacterized protein O0I10_002647 [Lichtheimia ornata]KAJ8661381.1 hypothetical protein O0I10_002647 [Lichtheimia ornata]